MGDHTASVVGGVLSNDPAGCHLVGGCMAGCVPCAAEPTLLPAVAATAATRTHRCEAIQIGLT